MKTISTALIGVFVGIVMGVASSVYYVYRLEHIQFEAHMLAASSALQEHNIEDARFHWHVAISLNQSEYGPYLNLAKTYAQEQRKEFALRLYRRALDLVDQSQSDNQRSADRALILREIGQLGPEKGT